MHSTKCQVQYYIFYCITQLLTWVFWTGLYTGDQITFTSAVLIPFLLGLLIFSIVFLPFYLRKEER